VLELNGFFSQVHGVFLYKYREMVNYRVFEESQLFLYSALLCEE
jgi:hypothetical protein